MATGNANKIALLAQLESPNGSGSTPPTFDHDTDVILLFENKTPVTPEFEEIKIIPIRGSLAPASSIIGPGRYRHSPVSMLQRAEDFGAIPKLPPRIGRLMRMCAVNENITATEIIYRPTSSAFESGVLRWFPDGSQRDSYFVFGTFTIDATAGREQKISFQLQGVYNGETNNVTYPTDLIYEASSPTSWKGANLVISKGGTVADTAGKLTVSGDTAVTPALIVKSIQFTAGVPVAEIRDANAANAVFGYDISAVRDPRVTLTIERDKNPNINFITDWAAQTMHHLKCNFDDDRIAFFAPYAQIVGRPDQEDQGRATLQLTYALIDPTASEGVGDDWQFTWVG